MVLKVTLFSILVLNGCYQYRNTIVLTHYLSNSHTCFFKWVEMKFLFETYEFVFMTGRVCVVDLLLPCKLHHCIAVVIKMDIFIHAIVCDLL